MLRENIRIYRKAKGLSQEELAAKLNVVRQTVSKWEKGLSVPDSEMLITLAEALDVSVADLLGETASGEEAPTLQSLAAKLELLNEQFAKRAERSRKLWRLVFVVVCCVAAAVLLFELIALIYYLAQPDVPTGENAAVAIIGGADGPTAILIASESIKLPTFLVAAIALIVSVLGIRKTK